MDGFGLAVSQSTEWMTLARRLCPDVAGVKDAGGKRGSRSEPHMPAKLTSGRLPSGVLWAHDVILSVACEQ